MRLLIADSFEDRGKDALAHNPGNLYAYYSPIEPLPLVCPFSPSEACAPGVDYVVQGPKGWALVRDSATDGVKVISAVRPSVVDWWK